MAAETIDLKNKVVAVFDDRETASRAQAAATGLGGSVTVLEGEEGKARLPQNAEGVKGALKTLAMTFGDEIRVLEGLDEALTEGAQVLVVEVAEANADQVAAKLDQNQGRFVWSFGEWTFKPATPATDDQDTA